MAGSRNIIDIIKEAKGLKGERKFSQAIEMTITLKDIDAKKEVNVNEVVELPHPFQQKGGICLFASGDLGVRAKKAGIDRVIDADELDKIGGEKKDAKKLIRDYSFFLAELSLMSKVGKLLGAYLGPKGKMPAPVPPTAPIEGFLKRFSSAIRVKSRGQMAITCKIGMESMNDEELADNGRAVIEAIDKKLPGGHKNMRGIYVKTTMGKIVSGPV
ncbi:MAG: 50S ribosomal protein L1 [Nitrosopumilus sp.]